MKLRKWTKTYEQFLGEEKHKVGSKVRGDEGLGKESSEEEKVSDLFESHK